MSHIQLCTSGHGPLVVMFLQSVSLSGKSVQTWSDSLASAVALLQLGLYQAENTKENLIHASSFPCDAVSVLTYHCGFLGPENKWEILGGLLLVFN